MTKKNDLAHRVAALFASPRYRPLPERDLAQRLHLGPGQRGQLRDTLRQLEANGHASHLRGGRWGPPTAQQKPIQGTFRVRQNGSCWIVPEDPARAPMWIDPSAIGVAMNGDQIQALPVRRDSSARMLGARPDTKPARVVRVLERKRQWVVGILQATPHAAYIVPRDPLLKANIKLTDSPRSIEEHMGNLVVARITEDEPSEGRPVTATFSEDLGDPEGVENDIRALLFDRGYSNEFPESVTKAARKVHGGLKKHGADPRGRVDLRNHLIMTIDPATAHDYDDAVSIEPLSGGRWKLGVHIADVAAYVERDSVIDREAIRRGNSTYMVDRVIRMLPKDLTVRVCSLQPHEDHLAHTVELIFDSKGHVLESKTYRSIICSKACLSYEQVQSFFETGQLDGSSKEIRTALTHLRRLAKQIRALRFKNGALDFSLPEVHCDLDADGNPIGFTKRGSTEAYNLIEECMLAANQSVAGIIEASPFAGIYRIHDEPGEEQWARMADELRFLGVDSPPETTKELNQLARSVVGKPEQYMVTLTLLRSMKRAIYEAESSPHFGLGFAHYAHFTSPIRRYPDLVLHRILIGIEEGQKSPVYSQAEIEKLAIHCSATERESAEMEIQSIQIKRIRYFADQLEKGEVGPFTGTIISLNPKGLIIELADTLQQGMLPYAAIGRERYFLAPDGHSASARGGFSYRLGQSIKVGLASVDEHLKRVNFFLSTPLGRRKGSASRKGRPARQEKAKGKSLSSKPARKAKSSASPTHRSPAKRKLASRKRTRT